MCELKFEMVTFVRVHVCAASASLYIVAGVRVCAILEKNYNLNIFWGFFDNDNWTTFCSCSVIVLISDYRGQLQFEYLSYSVWSVHISDSIYL